MFCAVAESWRDNPHEAVHSLRRQLETLDIPVSRSEALWDDVAETLTQGRSKGRGIESYGQGYGAYNRIPSDHHGECCSDLLAYCLGSDNFGDRLAQLQNHIEHECPQTRSVTFITSRWDVRKWANHRNAFQRANAHITIVLDCDGVLIPVLY